LGEPRSSPSLTPDQRAIRFVLDVEAAKLAGQKIDRKALLAAWELPNGFLAQQAGRLLREHRELVEAVKEGSLALPTNPASWDALKKRLAESAEPVQGAETSAIADAVESKGDADAVERGSKLVPRPEPGEADRPRFEELKRVVRDGIETFLDVSLALIEIRNRRLYRLAGFERFGDFCQAEFHLSRSYAYQLMDAAASVECLSTIRSWGHARPWSVRFVDVASQLHHLKGRRERNN